MLLPALPPAALIGLPTCLLQNTARLLPPRDWARLEGAISLYFSDLLFTPAFHTLFGVFCSKELRLRSAPALESPAFL